MKYVVIDERQNDEFIDEFNDKEKALEHAAYMWGYLSKIDKKHCKAFYVLESVNPDEEAENHLDGEPIKVYK